MGIQIDGISEAELKEMFYEEADSLLDTYEQALLQLETAEDLTTVKNAYSEVFRVFHSFKGAGAYFEEMSRLVDFASKSCEIYRHIDEQENISDDLATWTVLGHSQLRTAVFASKKGLPLTHFVFYYPPEKLLTT